MALSLNTNNNWLVNVNAAGNYQLTTAGKYLDRNINVAVPTSGKPKAAATDGVTYTALTDVQLVDNGVATTLYIDPGYTSGYSLSLDSLLPDFDSTIDGTSGQILKGFKAYDDKGNEITGTLETITPNTIYYQTSTTGAIAASSFGPGNIASTYYVKAGSATISGGGLSATSNFNKTDLQVTQTATANGGMAIGEAVDTAPESGYYITFNSTTPAVSGTTTVKRAAVGESVTAGWITSIDGEIGEDTCNASVSVNETNKTVYIPINTGVCEVKGGTLTITGATINAPTTSMEILNSTNTGITESNDPVASYVTAQPNSGYYVAIKASTAETSGVASATRAAVTDKHTAGYIEAQDATTVSGLDSDTKTASVNVSSGSITGYVKLKEGSCEVKGGGLSVTTTGTLSVASSDVSLLESAPSSTYYTITTSATKSTISRAAVTDKHTVGYIPARAETTVIASDTADVTPASKSYYINKQTYGTIVSSGTNSTVELSDNTFVPSSYVFKTTNSGYNASGATVATVSTYLGEFSFTAIS